MIELLNLFPGARVLDVGSGVGSDVEALAHGVYPGGHSVGIDRSRTMLAEARRRSLGTRHSVFFLRADSHALPFATASFDACRAERILQHLVDPAKALAEMARVTRPGGRIVVVEPDYGTELIAGASPEITQRVLECRRAHIAQPTIGRALPVMYKTLGLTDLSVRILRTGATELHDDERQVVERYARRAVDAGAITAAQAGRWCVDLESAAATGQYRHIVAVFLIAGQR